MTKIVEPPILLSRILTFVLATSVVVVLALLFTLWKMVPLERPEVFFLSTSTRSTNVTIEPMVPDSSNKNVLGNYQAGFIREYVIARNTLYANSGTTRKNWLRVIRPWSSPDIYSKFTNTHLYKEFAFGERMPNISCDVIFSSPTNNDPVLRMSNDTYNVEFAWVCKNIGGQTTQKFYKIQIKIQSNLDKKISGTLENLEKLRDNPLGIQVVQYNSLGGRNFSSGDPLDQDMASW